MVPPESSHLQGVRNESAGFLRQILDVPVHVVVGHQHGAACGEQIGNLGFQLGDPFWRQNLRFVHGHPVCREGVVW